MWNDDTGFFEQQRNVQHNLNTRLQRNRRDRQWLMGLIIVHTLMILGSWMTQCITVKEPILAPGLLAVFNGLLASSAVCSLWAAVSVFPSLGSREIMANAAYLKMYPIRRSLRGLTIAAAILLVTVDMLLSAYSAHMLSRLAPLSSQAVSLFQLGVYLAQFATVVGLSVPTLAIVYFETRILINHVAMHELAKNFIVVAEGTSVEGAETPLQVLLDKIKGCCFSRASQSSDDQRVLLIEMGEANGLPTPDRTRAPWYTGL